MTWLSWVLAIFGFYYLFLYGSLKYRQWRHAKNLDRTYRPMVCMIIQRGASLYFR
jgi:hypothetical protein